MTKPSHLDEPELVQRAHRLQTGRNSPKAGRALGEMGKKALPALHAALDHDNAFVRSGALHGFAAITPSSDAMVDVIVGALSKDPDPRVRETACMMLGQLGATAVTRAKEALDAVANDPDERVRTAAAKALAIVL